MHFNLEYIKQFLQKIEELKEDEETAHSAEDSLYYEFAKYIADLDDDSIRENILEIRDMAREVIKTKSMEFSRWYA